MKIKKKLDKNRTENHTIRFDNSYYIVDVNSNRLPNETKVK